MKCPSCGAELTEDTRFCSYCGVEITHDAEKVNDTITEADAKPHANIKTNTPPKKKTGDAKSEILQKFKKKGAEFWSGLSVFEKISTVMLCVIVLFCLASFSSGKTGAGVISVLQIMLVVAALLIHRGMIKCSKEWLKYAALAVAVLLTAINVTSYSWKSNAKTPTAKPSQAAPSVSSESKSDKGEQITQQPREIAVPLAASECIGEDCSAIVETYRSAGFKTVSEEPLEDLELVDIDKTGLVAQIVIDGNSSFGSGYKCSSTSKITISYHELKKVNAPISSADAAYTDLDEIIEAFENSGFSNFVTEEQIDLNPDQTKDEFRNVVTIADTKDFSVQDVFALDSKIKIVTHRPYEKCTVKIHINFIPNFLFNKYGVDVSRDYMELGTLSHGEDGDFEMRLKPGKYTFTFTKTGWKAPTKELELDIKGNVDASYDLICYEDSIHLDLMEYFDEGAVGENEVAVPASYSTFKYDNYKDVQQTLKDAGFTNISTAVLYDIVLGWTSEGEVAGASIDGKTDYIRGDVFSKDAPIIITYHMKEEDDPNRASASSAAPTKEPTITPVDNSGTGAENQPQAVTYSTNDLETAKKGNTGAFSYKSKGGSYNIYYIIDFDEGYVYRFIDGNGDETCDRLKIVSGDLNSYVLITYHDGGTTWDNALCFKWKNQPDHLILQDDDGFSYDFYSTDLTNAKNIRSSKTIVDY